TMSSATRVQLNELPKTLDIELSSAFVAQALADMPMRAALERPADDPDAGEATVHIELHRNEAKHVFGRGRLKGWFKVACSRCVGDVRVDLDEELLVTFMPQNEMVLETEDEEPDSEEGVELSAEDLDVFGYEGDVIDLEPLLHEQLILAVPYAPLCSESCKGLCPQCGTDRNREECGCAPVVDM